MTSLTINPSLAELDEATARTEAVMGDLAAGPAGRLAAAEREAALYDALAAQPGWAAQLEAHEAEMEAN